MALEIVQIPLSEIKPYKKNARKNDEAVPKVVESIKRYGFKNPIILDKNNVIICGHTRYMASLEMGFDTVPCIIATDLTKKQVKEFRLVENRTNEYALWNYELLNDEMQGLDLSEFEFPTLTYEDELSAEDLESLLEDSVSATDYNKDKKEMIDNSQKSFCIKVVVNDLADRQVIENYLTKKHYLYEVKEKK